MGETSDVLLRIPGVSWGVSVPGMAMSEIENDTPPPAQKKDEIARFVAQVEKYVSQLEAWVSSPPAQVLSPRLYDVARTQAKLVSAQCDYVLAMLDSGLVGMPFPMVTVCRKDLEQFLDRLDEIVDSLAWSAEAPEALRSLAMEETCG